MSHTRPQKRPQPLPMADKFVFTDKELSAIQKGMLVSTRMMAYYRWGLSGYRQYSQDLQMQRYNQQASRRVLRAVRTAVPTPGVPERELQLVYEAARAAYNNAKHFQADEATARRRAVMSAQTALEFVIGVFRKIHMHPSSGMHGSHRCSECGGPA